MNTKEQQYLNDLDKTLWTAADKLRTTLSAAEYKHAVLGLIFLKYVSDTFEERRKELDRDLRDPEHEIYLDPADFDAPEVYEKEIQYELEVRDSYTEKNVFWVPERSRWNTLVDLAKLPVGEPLPWEKKKWEKEEDRFEKMKGVDFLIDDALDAIEKDNTKLKGVLNKTYTRLNLDNDKLSELIDHINTIPPAFGSLHTKDILGHVYEFFLGEFAAAEGKKGGQYYTPKSVVSLFVEMLQPFKGRVYDPAMGSGGFFVQSERFIEKYGGKVDDINVYGQEYNHTTWQLAAMNMAIRGIDFDFGKGPADTLTNDQHPDLRADYIMANPPFNIREWWNKKLENDVRWKYGKPPEGNANFAWLQHMIHHLAPQGSMGLLLANGSMSSTTSGEGDIRENVIKADLIECMVALPGQLFTNTQIPACIWFLTKNKQQTDTKRDRRGEVLFIDAREKGYMKDRVLRDFTEEDISDIANTFHLWQASTSSASQALREGGHAELSREAGQVEVRPTDPATENTTPPVSSSSPDENTTTPPVSSSSPDENTTTPPVSSSSPDEIGTYREQKEETQSQNTEVRLSEVEAYEDIPGFCKSATLDDIAKHDYVLTPGRYVGSKAIEEDSEPFADKMQRLTATLKIQLEESDRLEQQIKEQLGGLGYNI